MDYLNKIASPLGGVKKYGIVCLIIFVVYMIAGTSASAQRARIKKAEAESVVQASIAASQAIEDVNSQLPGTYLGHNGSILVLKADHTAFYFFRHSSSDNVWSYDNGVLSVSFPSIGGCNTSATITSPENLNGFSLAGVTDDDVYCWDAEEFSRYSDNQSDIEEQNCISIIESELNITYETTTAETEATTAAANSETPEASDIRSLLDEYESVANDLVDLCTQASNIADDDYAGQAQLLLDYADLETRMTALQAQLELVDESSLTEEDYQYYLEVEARINARLAEANLQ